MEVLSIVVAVVSMVLAAVAIGVSLWAAKESRYNYDRTKDVLTEIDKKASLIEKVITDSHKQLLDVATAKPDAGEQFAAAFLPMMMQDPKKAGEFIESLQPLMELGERAKK